MNNFKKEKEKENEKLVNININDFFIEIKSKIIYPKIIVIFYICFIPSFVLIKKLSIF